MYYKVGGVAASASWIEVGNARDVTVTQTRGTSDTSKRGGGGYESEEPTLMKLSADGDILADDSNAPFAYMEAAFEARTLVGWAFANGDIAVSGTKYRQFDGKISEWNLPQPLAETNKVSFKIAPCDSDTNPSWEEVP